MGLEGFIEPFCSALEHHQLSLQPSNQDSQFLDMAIKNFKNATIEDASPHLDKFLQALLLKELWAERKISDNDIHGYMNSLIWRFMPMNDDLKENRFFYLELTDSHAVKNGIDMPNTRGLWRKKGDTCLIVGGLFGDYVRAQRPASNRYFPSAQETRNSGKSAYHRAHTLFSRFNAREEQNLAQICSSIRDNYEALEDTLYSLGRNHFFPDKEEKTSDQIIIPTSPRVKAHYNLDKPIPKTIRELFRRSKIMTIYRRMFNKGYFD